MQRLGRDGPVGELGLQRGPHLGPLPGQLEAVDEGIDVEAGPPDEHGWRAAPVEVVEHGTAGLDEAGQARLLEGSNRSSRWCGTSARSARLALAVPMSMPR